MPEQIYFTKEIIQHKYDSYKTYLRSLRFISYNPNADIKEKYCPRCDSFHKYDCNLIQMIVEFNGESINANTICSITFIENIRIPLFDFGIDDKYKNKLGEKAFKQKLYDTHVIPIETMSYKYIENITQTNFNLKLFADSFADDELESFRSNVDKFKKIFNNIHIEKDIDEIKYLLLTEYKNDYISKQEFLLKHKATMYEDKINFVISHFAESHVIIYKQLSSKSNYVSNAIITKLITLYIDFQINPLFDATNFGDKKPNPHVSKKIKQK